jgi:hypothetical protein
MPATPGMHRVYWLPVKPEGNRSPGFAFFRERTLLTGTFSARLTVNGQTYTQSFTVGPDPRSSEL